MRLIQLILGILFLSIAANALDCTKFSLTTSSGGSEFLTSDNITLFLKDVSVRCKDKNKCFEDYTSAELVLPESCSDSFSTYQPISERASVLYEPWHVTCKTSGNYTFRVKVTGSSENENCEEQMSIKIYSPKLYKPTTTATDTESENIIYQTIQVEQPPVHRTKKTKDYTPWIAILSIFVVLLFLFLILLITAVAKKRNIPKKERNSKLKQSY